MECCNYKNNDYIFFFISRISYASFSISCKNIITFALQEQCNLTLFNPKDISTG